MRLSREQRVAEEEREAAWLESIESGEYTISTIAQMSGLSIRRVQERILRARDARPDHREPRLLPVFPGGAKPLRLGSCEDVHPGSDAPIGPREVCMVCNHSQCDHLLTGLSMDARAEDGPTKYDPPSDGLRGGKE